MLSKLLRKHTAELMEHCDTVLILITKHNTETGSTISIDRGDGNWYARYGQAREWLLREDVDARDLSNEDDEDEEDSMP